jgi:hypothetical protein
MQFIQDAERQSGDENQDGLDRGREMESLEIAEGKEKTKERKLDKMGDLVEPLTREVDVVVMRRQDENEEIEEDGGTKVARFFHGQPVPNLLF